MLPNWTLLLRKVSSMAKYKLPEPNLKGSTLKYPAWMYGDGLSSGQMTIDEAKVEYQRLYRMLRERQRRMQKSPEWKSEPFATKPLKKLSQIKTEAQLRENLQILANKASSHNTSIKGREMLNVARVAWLDKYGEGKSFGDFTKAQWKEFGTFMRRVKESGFDSERAVALFRLGKSAGMTGASMWRDYQTWLDPNNQQSLKEYAERINRPLGGRVSSERLREHLGIHKINNMP